MTAQIQYTSVVTPNTWHLFNFTVFLYNFALWCECGYC